jgi:hypothetical protein
MASPEWPRWLEAINKELDGLEAFGVMDILDQDPSMWPIISANIILKRKRDGTYKARMVAIGYQEPVKNNENNYAPTLSYVNTRFILATGLQMGLHATFADVKQAFLHAALDEPIYIRPPKGSRIPANKLLRLKKSLYGLRSASMLWQKHFRDIAISFGWVQCHLDPCIYRRNGELLCIYVDDVIILSRTPGAKAILKELSTALELKVLSSTLDYRGIDIFDTPKAMYMTLHGAIERTLKKYGMVKCHPVSTPSTGRLDEDIDSTELNATDKATFQALRGSLLFIVNAGRSDAQYAIKELCRINRPTQLHLIAAKRILRFFAGTKDLALQFPKTKTFPLYKAYSDSDFAGDEKTRKSQTGMAHYIGEVAFHLNSKNQEIIALSTFEAELIAASKNAREILYYRQLAAWLGNPQEGPTTLYCDNEATIKFISNGDDKITSRTKHIDIRYKHLQSQRGRTINMEYVNTADNIADLFTKPLGKNKFWDFVHGAKRALFTCYNKARGAFSRNQTTRGGVET